MAGEARNGKYLSDENVRREDDKFNAERARLGEISKGRECVWHTNKRAREMLASLERGEKVNKECLGCLGYDFECERYAPREAQK